MCLNASDGKQIWMADLLKSRGGKLPEYGFAASPVIVGEKVIVDVGAGGGKSLAAYDKKSGKLLWTSLDDKIGYSTPLSVTIDGVPQVIILMGEALVSVSPRDGKEFWRKEWKTELDANVATPIVSENKLFVSTGYSTGCALFQLSAKGGKPAAEKLWANKEMKNYFATSVLLDGYLYGFNNNKLTCLDFKTGKRKWQTGARSQAVQSRQPDRRRRKVDHSGRGRHFGPGRSLSAGLPRNLQVPILRRADLDRADALRRAAVCAEREGDRMSRPEKVGRALV